MDYCPVGKLRVETLQLLKNIYSGAPPALRDARMPFDKLRAARKDRFQRTCGTTKEAAEKQF